MNCFTFLGALKAVFFPTKETLTDKKWTSYIENIQENNRGVKGAQNLTLNVYSEASAGSASAFFSFFAVFGFSKTFMFT